MAPGVTSRRGETAQHAQLKQLAFVWAQAHGFSACAMEVTLPRCRYRADVAGCRPHPKQIGSTAIFECKRALCDLRRDNCHSKSTRHRLEEICKRREFLEARLRTHYPHLHNGDSLFPEFDFENFSAIGHRGYARLEGLKIRHQLIRFSLTTGCNFYVLVGDAGSVQPELATCFCIIR